jgi:hypothetical protein
MSVDTELIVESLRKRGHAVQSVIKVPENAGDYEFVVDGATLTLDETRELLERDQAADRHAPTAPKSAVTT